MGPVKAPIPVNLEKMVRALLLLLPASSTIPVVRPASILPNPIHKMLKAMVKKTTPVEKNSPRAPAARVPAPVMIIAFFPNLSDRIPKDITEAILKVISRHTQLSSPFDIYAKALHEFFKGHEITAGEWEESRSKMFPHLDRYQKEAYWALMKIARQFGGAFLCDSVGLGKTFIGLMLLERLLLKDNKRVVLLVPKAARKPVWEAKINKYMPEILNGFLPFKIINHTDLTRQASSDIDWPKVIDSVGKQAEVIVIDESHHFRNRMTNRYQRFFEEKVKSTTELYKTLLDMRKEIGKSLKDEIEIRRRIEKDEGGGEGLEEILDVRKLAKKIETLKQKGDDIKDKVTILEGGK